MAIEKKILGGIINGGILWILSAFVFSILGLSDLSGYSFYVCFGIGFLKA